MDVFVAIVLILLLLLSTLNYLTLAGIYVWAKSKLYTNGVLMAVSSNFLDDATPVDGEEEHEEEQQKDSKGLYF